MLTIILSTLKTLLSHAYQWATCLACNFVSAFYSIFSQGLYAILTWRLLVMPKNPSSSSSLHNKPSAPILPSNKQCATHLKKGHHCGSVHLLCTNSKGDRKRKVNLAFRRSAFATMKADVTCSTSFWGGKPQWHYQHQLRNERAAQSNNSLPIKYFLCSHFA